MLRDVEQVRQFEDDEIRRRPPDYIANLEIFTALWMEARRLGVLPPVDPLEGIEHDIQLARALNVRSTS